MRTGLTGQSAIEFLMIFIVFVAAITITAWASLERTNEINAAKKQLEIDGILNDISGKIDTAFLEGSGFSTKLKLPEKLFGLDYSVEIYSSSVYLDLEGVTHIRHLMTENVTGSLVKSENTIRNKDDIIVIEN